MKWININVTHTNKTIFISIFLFITDETDVQWLGIANIYV